MLAVVRLEAPEVTSGAQPSTHAIEVAVRALQARNDPKAPLDLPDSEALALIYEQYREVLVHTARRYVGNTSDAEDVVQEVMLRLPTLIHQYRHGGLAGWLRRIAVTTVLMRLRRQKREVAVCELEPDGNALPDEVFERVDQVRRALGVLPRPQREVVVLRFFLEYSHEEIGRALGITATASEIRLCRALKRLRGHLQSDRLPPQRSA